MRAKPFSCLIISMIGLYAIFSALLVAGMPLLIVVMSLFARESQLERVGYMSLVCIPQFILPFALGVFLLRRASWITDRILRRNTIDPSMDVFPAISPDVSGLAFSLLGVFLLSNTIPRALQDIAAWFQIKAAEAGSMTGFDSASFWRDRFPTIIYHVAALLFSLFVFLRGKRIAGFVDALRTFGAGANVRNQTAQQSGTDDSDLRQSR